MSISLCHFDEIAFIPKEFDTGVAQFTKRKKPEIWFKHTDQGMITGCACLLVVGHETARLSRLFVMPEKRSEGIATKLIKARIEYARIKNFKQVDAKTYLDYTKYGFYIKQQYKNEFYWWMKVLKK
tara:strand:- start:110 stop:487 length:378 start_codon:yes stop_codon:yes gene_type:complete